MAPRARCGAATCGIAVPDAFAPRWYERAVPRLVVELGGYCARREGLEVEFEAEVEGEGEGEGGARGGDVFFVNEGLGVVGVVDCGAGGAEGEEGGVGRRLLAFFEDRLLHNLELYSREATVDLRRVLSLGLERCGARPACSALLVECKSNMLRAAWVGSCAFLVIRDGQVAYRSYSKAPVRDALDSALHEEGAGASGEPDAVDMHRRKSWQFWRRRGSSSATGGRMDSAVSGLHSAGASLAVDCDDVRAEYMELQDQDLIIAGSAGLFSNLSEDQMLAFVRPVPDAYDHQLALANATCLGSWRTDDPAFIAYYLAHLGFNFATAETTAPLLPSAFPVGGRGGDVTVLVAACSFER